MFQALNNEQQQEIVIKEQNTGILQYIKGRLLKKYVEGEKTQYNLRNFWLFNPKSEELLISLLCPKVSC